MKTLEEIKKNHQPQDTLLVAERTCFSRNYVQQVLKGTRKNQKVLELLAETAELRMAAEKEIKKSIDKKIKNK